MNHLAWMSRWWRGASLLSLSCVFTACVADPRLNYPPRPITPTTLLSLESGNSGIVEELRVTYSVQPPPGEEWDIVTDRPWGEPGDDGRLQGHIAWTDFSGEGPVSWGRAVTRQFSIVREGGEGDETPWTGEIRFPLPTPGKVLARRISVDLVLFPVDVVIRDKNEQGEGESGRVVGRSGGIPINFQKTTLESFVGGDKSLRPRVWDPLNDNSQNARETFLWAVTSPADLVWDTLDQLVTMVLSEGVPNSVKDAAYGGLTYCTDLQLGRDAHRWRAWWAAEKHNLKERLGRDGE